MRILPFVAIDDFTFRKGVDYGTLLCDLKTGQPIDLLPSRKQKDVTKWIHDHPTILLMSRDGSLTYQKAIEETERPIVQIMDRFHLLQILYRYMLEALQRLLPQRWEKPQETEVTLQSFENTKLEPHPLNLKQQKKWDFIQSIQKEHQNGLSLRELSRKYKIDRRTISKYVHLKEFPVQKRKSRGSRIDPYLETVYKEVNNHSTSRKIYEQIKKQGFEGGFDTVRVRVAAIRKKQKKLSTPKKSIKSYHRKSTISLYLPNTS